MGRCKAAFVLVRIAETTLPACQKWILPYITAAASRSVTIIRVSLSSLAFVVRLAALS